MAYNKSWTPKSATPTGNQLILAIGRRAYVHLPSTGAIAGEFVPFGEKPGAPPAHELSDGQEVEIIGWRPTGPDGICYHVQRKSDGREWWARATCLRTSASERAA